MSMLFSDYDATPRFLTHLHEIAKKILVAKRENKPRVELALNENRYLVSDLFASYLMDHLCRLSPGKGVGIVDAYDVQKIYEQIIKDAPTVVELQKVTLQQVLDVLHKVEAERSKV